jgi:transcriptional regulator with XRE-family HTH domain
MKKDSFGLRLAKARTEAGYSVAKAARALDMSYSHLYRIENNEVLPGIMIARKLARLYRVSLDWLVDMYGNGGDM